MTKVGMGNTNKIDFADERSPIFRHPPRYRRGVLRHGHAVSDGLTHVALNFFHSIHDLHRADTGANLRNVTCCSQG